MGSGTGKSPSAWYSCGHKQNSSLEVSAPHRQLLAHPNPDKEAGSKSAHPADSFFCFFYSHVQYDLQSPQFCPPHNSLQNPNPRLYEAGIKDGPRVWMTLISITSQSKKSEEGAHKPSRGTDWKSDIWKPKTQARDRAQQPTAQQCQQGTAGAHRTVCLIVLNAFAFSKFCPSPRGNLRARGARPSPPSSGTGSPSQGGALRVDCSWFSLHDMQQGRIISLALSFLANFSVSVPPCLWISVLNYWIF